MTYDLDPAELRRRLTAARELAEVRAARAEALVAEIRSQAPAGWQVVVLAVTAAVTVPAGLWQGAAVLLGWPLLPYEASRLAGEAVPLLLLGVLALLSKQPRISLLCTTAGALWAGVVTLGWTAPLWTQPTVALVNLGAAGAFLLMWRRRLQRWQLELHRVQLLAPPVPVGPAGPPLPTPALALRRKEHPPRSPLGG